MKKILYIAITALFLNAPYSALAVDPINSTRQTQATEEGMNIVENKTLDDTLNKILGTPAGLEFTCKEIARVAMPTYYPSYMIQYGMGAFVRSESGDALVIDFDAKTEKRMVIGEHQMNHRINRA
jgi:hypothetical protein